MSIVESKTSISLLIHNNILGKQISVVRIYVSKSVSKVKWIISYHYKNYEETMYVVLINKWHQCRTRELVESLSVREMRSYEELWMNH